MEPNPEVVVALTELSGRLLTAATQLTALGEDRLDNSNSIEGRFEAMRLAGKAQGALMARSYIEEMLRS
jgi:hypothetical protein